MPDNSKPKLFPNQFNLLLERGERSAFDDLFEKEPWWREPIELLHAVIRKGLVVMKEDAEENYDPHQPTRTQLTARAANADGQTSSATSAIAPHRCIERYIGAPISEEIRQRLEDVLDDHEDLTEEDLYQGLLQLGLDKLEENPEALKTVQSRSDRPSPTNKVLARLAHRKAWADLCRNVARGWR
jgi:hypothetical protein